MHNAAGSRVVIGRVADFVFIDVKIMIEKQPHIAVAAGKVE